MYYINWLFNFFIGSLLNNILHVLKIFRSMICLLYHFNLDRVQKLKNI